MTACAPDGTSVACNATPGTPATFYRDQDGDGYGDSANTLRQCSAPAGYVENAGDCDDSNAAVHPGATEVCNGGDDDCNGLVDDGLGTTTCGVGACRRTVDHCVDGIPRTCVPGEPSAEVCNGIDDNCDGRVDEGLTRRVGRVWVACKPLLYAKPQQ
jgi:hypothetical protein